AAKTFDTLGGNDVLYGRNNTSPTGDTLSDTGVSGSNLVDGRAGDDSIDLSASTGNNYLYGGLGNDTLKGGSGNDTLVGGYGLNSLTGNGGQDTFILQRGGVSVIQDFVSGTDKIWIDTFVGSSTSTPGVSGTTGTVLTPTATQFASGAGDNLNNVG